MDQFYKEFGGNTDKLQKEIDKLERELSSQNNKKNAESGQAVQHRQKQARANKAISAEIQQLEKDIEKQLARENELQGAKELDLQVRIMTGNE